MSKPYALKQISHAIASDNGMALKFAFQTHSGELLECECPPNAVPEIVARLTAALDQAARNAGTTGAPYRCFPIVADRTSVEINTEARTVIPTLFVAPMLGIPFALTPDMADQLSSQLAAGAAMLGRSGIAKPKN